MSQSQFDNGARVVWQRNIGTVIGPSNGDGYIITFDSGFTLFCYNNEVRSAPVAS